MSTVSMMHYKTLLSYYSCECLQSLTLFSVPFALIRKKLQRAPLNRILKSQRRSLIRALFTGDLSCIQLKPQRQPLQPTLSSIDLLDWFIDSLCLYRERKLQARRDGRIKEKRDKERVHKSIPVVKIWSLKRLTLINPDKNTNSKSTWTKNVWLHSTKQIQGGARLPNRQPRLRTN